MPRPAIAHGVTIEQVSDDLLVFVPGSHEVFKLTGVSADKVWTIHTGGAVAVDGLPAELFDRGIITSTRPLSRRGLIKAGAIGAGAGIAVMAMPTVAMASSALQVRGVYHYVENFIAVLIFGFDFPSELRDSGAPGAVAPTQLVISSPSLNLDADETYSSGGSLVPETFAEFAANVGPGGPDFVLFVGDDGGISGTATLSGSFSWGGVPYVANNISYDADLALIL